MPRLRLIIHTGDSISSPALKRLLALRSGLEAIAARQHTGQIISITTRPRRVEFVLAIDGKRTIRENVIPLLRKVGFTRGVRLYYLDGSTFEQVPYRAGL